VSDKGDVIPDVDGIVTMKASSFVPSLTTAVSCVFYVYGKQVASDGKTLVSDKGDIINYADVIVFATGFNLTAPIFQFDIQARGCDLSDTIKARPEAYLGLAVAGFPNMFMLLGLNTGG
jgi:hypothetical protein